MGKNGVANKMGEIWSKGGRLEKSKKRYPENQPEKWKSSSFYL